MVLSKCLGKRKGGGTLRKLENGRLNLCVVCSGHEFIVFISSFKSLL